MGLGVSMLDPRRLNEKLELPTGFCLSSSYPRNVSGLSSSPSISSSNSIKDPGAVVLQREHEKLEDALISPNQAEAQ